ncbi:MAG: hypothetical protein RL706_256 [Pseudomonadota bacterium]|jgi:hypothetical protein
MAKISFWVRIIAASLAAVVLSASLSGCSAIKLGYNQLPEISSWWLDNYANFTDTQAAQTKQALKKLQAWHRKEELPLIADLLGQAQSMAPHSISPQQACEVWGKMEKRIEAVALESSRLATPIVLQLTPRQLRHLEKQWAVKNDDWKKDWLQANAEDRLKKRLDATVDRFSDMYGDLNTEQVKLLKQQIEQSIWSPEVALQNRIKRQQAQLQILQNLIQESTKPGFNLAQAEKTVLQLSLQSVRPQDPVLLNLQLQIEQQACVNFSQLHNTTTPAQRQKAQRRLRAYETDLRDLI